MPDFLLQALAPGQWPTLALLTARLTGLFMVAPLWSMTDFPRPARAALILVFAILLMPGARTAVLPESWTALPLPLAGEFAIGMLIGLTAAVLVHGVTIAGEILSVQSGLQLGPALGPMPEVELSGLGQIHTLLALLVYVSVGGHLMLLRALADSVHAMPPGSILDCAAIGRMAGSAGGTLFLCALRTAAPVMATLIITNVLLGALSRAVPQINTMIVSLPVTLAVALLMLGAVLPMLASGLHAQFSGLSRQLSSLWVPGH